MPGILEIRRKGEKGRVREREMFVVSGGRIGRYVYSMIIKNEM